LCSLVKRAKSLQKKVHALTRLADAVLQTLEVGEMEQLLQDCNQLQLELPNRQLQRIRSLLSLPASELLKLQLQKALEQGDTRRAAEITVKVKGLWLQREGQGERFELVGYPKLRSPQDFCVRWGLRTDFPAAVAHMSGRAAEEKEESSRPHSQHRYREKQRRRQQNDQIAQGEEHMLQHSQAVIGTSLTELSPPGHENEQVRSAISIFRAILGFMGDRPYPFPALLAEDIIERVEGNSALQDEVFCQLMKQMTNNPSLANMNRGWALMSQVLQKISPSPQLENYLEVFLRLHGREDMVLTMHLAIQRPPIEEGRYR
jgi:hypothetical protein